MELLQIFIALCGLVLTMATKNKGGMEMESPWTWFCAVQEQGEGTCVKSLRSKINPPSRQSGTPLDICKLNCGKNGVLWPLPTGKIEIGKELVHFIPGHVEFAPFQAEDPEVKVMLQNVSAIFRGYLRQMHPDYDATSGKPVFSKNGNGERNKVIITVGTVWSDKVNTLTTDESYVLSVNTNDDKTIAIVTILANTFFGARHGLETLSQLIAYDEDANKLAIVSVATISDRPVFPYRGIMIDTARSFFSIESLKRLIDGMSYTKLNILHWHITDTHSFPIQLKRVPEMSLYGAYSQRQIYREDEVKDLVAYARIRGIKIVPEFDEPAHTGNGWQWGQTKGFGNLAVCVNQKPWSMYAVEPPAGQLNVVNEKVYDVLGNIFKDYLDMFDHDIFHMGGDEINFNCWNTTKEITDWMTENGMERTHAGFLQLWSRFQNKAYEKLKEANGGVDVTSILWTSDLTNMDVVEKHLSNATYVIQIWTKSNDALIPFLISRNYRLIFSNYDALYLDCGYGAWIGEGPSNWCSPYIGWQKIYSNSPIKLLANTSLTEAERAIKAGLILGAIAPMWTEQVDEAAVEGKVWPRATALAERLWTNPLTGWVDAEMRMVQNRQRFLQRGIQADLVQPEWCRQNEGECRL